MYVIYDTNKIDGDGKFVKVRANKEISFKSKSKGTYEYQFAMTETLNGNMYLWAVNAQPQDAEFEMYKIDVTANNIISSVFKDADGKAASIKIKYANSTGYAANDFIGHRRLSFTTTRNYSIQDNVLGILSYEGIDSKRGLTLYNEAEYIQKSKEGSISTMQCGNDSTDDIYYYAIKIND